MKILEDVRTTEEEMVGEILERGGTPVRLIVYDSEGNVLGCKADSEWTLRRDIFKVHPLEGKVPPERLVKSLIYMENEGFGMVEPFSIRRVWKTEDTSFRVVVEQLDSRGNPTKELMIFKVYKEGDVYRSEGPITN